MRVELTAYADQQCALATLAILEAELQAVRCTAAEAARFGGLVEMLRGHITGAADDELSTVTHARSASARGLSAVVIPFPARSR